MSDPNGSGDLSVLYMERENKKPSSWLSFVKKTLLNELLVFWFVVFPLLNASFGGKGKCLVCV